MLSMTDNTNFYCSRKSPTIDINFSFLEFLTKQVAKLNAASPVPIVSFEFVL